MENWTEHRMHRMSIYEDVGLPEQKMVQKKKKNALVIPGRTSLLTPRRMQCLPPNVISTVAKETSKFAMKEPTFEWRKKKQNKKRSVNSPTQL
ncbi:hypothetical protein TNCV_2406511 [Trichonephila clavipes]|nr:hypothetical protein TNCV_2406511 [Trichonephila clavipes]